MLRISRRRTSGVPSQFGGGDVGSVARPAAGRVVRVLPWSPVYPRGGESRAERTEVTVGDRLRRVLGDGRFHGVLEVLEEMSARDFTRAAEELQVSGYCLDVAGGVVRLRNRGRAELPQRLVDVVVRLDLTPRDEAPVREVAQQTKVASVEVVAGGGSEAGLVLSDPPGDLTLPVEWTLAMTAAVLGQRGAGKTYFAGVLVEELRARVPDLPVVVVDPTGSWWGIQAGAEGGLSDLGAVVLGGEHGAVDLSAISGAGAADLVRELTGRCVVCDLSRFARAEQVAFVADFFERLRTFQQFPVHVVLDEADLFCPQRFGAFGGDHRRCADAVEDHFMRGRLAGRGGTVVSLRPAVVAKNVLSQVECLFLLRMVEPNDLRAASAWLERHEHGVSDAQREECLAQMPALSAGTAYFLRGGSEATFRRFRTRAKKTYDSSRTLGTGGVSDVRCVELPADVLDRIREVMAREKGGEGG